MFTCPAISTLTRLPVQLRVRPVLTSPKITNEAVAKSTPGLTYSAGLADLDESVETVIAGAQRKNAVLSAKEKEIVAYHEIGHALVAAKQTDSAPVTKITIVPRTSGALGYTMQVDEGEHNLMSKDELLNKVATLTGKCSRGVDFRLDYDRCI